MMRRICGILLFFIPSLLLGQHQKDRGKLNGALESNMGFYMKDDLLDIVPEYKFAINTYLSLGYDIRKFRFGLQYELYEPPLVGYPRQLKGNKLIQGFGEYLGQRFSIRLGNIYEQFGSGLSFRAYEERGLGINNSILGTNVRWTPWDWLKLKGFAGMPRKYMEYVRVLVTGIDGEVEVSELAGEVDWTLILGGSWVLRQDYHPDQYPGVVRGYSGRGNFNYGLFSVGGEYTVKSPSLGYGLLPGYFAEKGSSFLCNLGIDGEGIGASLEFRRLNGMEFRTDNSGEESVCLNYVPALTRQHKYTLAALYPYTVQQNDEIGGQADVFGEIGWGNYPLKVSLNGAFYNRSEKEKVEIEGIQSAGRNLFREAGLELERKWSKNVKTIFSGVLQHAAESALEGFGGETIKSKILIGDVLYRMSSRNSLRMELQHMWSSGFADHGWIFGLLECGFAPHWMFSISDLYNYNTTGTSVHYYMVGGSFTSGGFRTSLSYGRNRAGFQCLGGICRYVPDYSGVNFSLTLTL